jgi:hypothetical protein
MLAGMVLLACGNGTHAGGWPTCGTVYYPPTLYCPPLYYSPCPPLYYSPCPPLYYYPIPPIFIDPYPPGKVIAASASITVILPEQAALFANGKSIEGYGKTRYLTTLPIDLDGTKAVKVTVVIDEYDPTIKTITPERKENPAREKAEPEVKYHSETVVVKPYESKTVDLSGVFKKSKKGGGG